MDSALGQILVQNNLVDREQLSKALKCQQQDVKAPESKLLGEILVDSGDISEDDLLMALALQAKLHEAEFFPLNPHPLVRSKAKRLLDIVGATVGCSILMFIFPIIAFAIYLDSAGAIFSYQYRIGLRGKQFRVYKFRTTHVNANHAGRKVVAHNRSPVLIHAGDRDCTFVGVFLRKLHLENFPQFLNVLRGEMSLVGPRPATLDEVKAYSKEDWQRLSIKPGMTGLWRTRRRHQRNVDCEHIQELDMTYVHRWKYYLDIKIIIKTLFPALNRYQLKSSRQAPSEIPKTQISLLNVDIDNVTQTQLLHQLKQGIVFTPNVDHLMTLQRDQNFFNVYNQADYKICDSQILVYASRFLNQPIQEKISGSDFFPAFCDFHKHNEAISIYLLGGAEGVAQKAQRRINRQSGRSMIVEAHSPSFGFSENHQECLEIVERINRCQPSVLAVGVGAPKQEKWICQYKDLLPSVKIFLAIGATIDFEAGHKERSPQWVSAAGLEWLFRLSREPKRLWKRYLVDDLPFFGLLIQQKLGLYQSPWPKVEQKNQSAIQPLRKSSSSS